jgi:hypothetical protein
MAWLDRLFSVGIVAGFFAGRGMSSYGAYQRG